MVKTDYSLTLGSDVMMFGLTFIRKCFKVEKRKKSGVWAPIFSDCYSYGSILVSIFFVMLIDFSSRRFLSCIDFKGKVEKIIV